MANLPKPFYQDDSCTIYCADCRDILPELPKVDLVLTDPPYNGDLKYGENTNDSRDWNEYLSWLLSIVKLSEATAIGPVIFFVSHTGALRLIPLHEPKWFGSWVQPGPSSNPIGRVGTTLIMPYFEPYLVYGDLKTIRASLPDVVQCTPSRERFGDHPCPKPIRLMARLIASGDFTTILDPFMGSGTTLVAAKQLGRKAIGIEIEEKYCQIAVERLRQTVMTFPEIKEQPKQAELSLG